jgi:hypothetical protein
MTLLNKDGECKINLLYIESLRGYNKTMPSLILQKVADEEVQTAFS